MAKRWLLRARLPLGQILLQETVRKRTALTTAIVCLVGAVVRVQLAAKTARACAAQTDP